MSNPEVNDPIWIDNAWLDTIVVIAITCFALCLYGLSKIPTAKMGMVYGIIGMTALIVGYWVDSAYTYGTGSWLIAVSMAPGMILGIWSAFAFDFTELPELVGAYNGFGGLAAALEGIGLYLDPSATYLVRNGDIIAPLTTPMLWIQAVALVLSIVIGGVTFTGSFVAVLKLHGNIASRPRVIPYRLPVTVVMFVAMIVLSVVAFSGDQGWNDRGAGLACIVLLTAVSFAYGIIFVMAIGGGDMPVSISFLNSLSGFSTCAAGFMLANKALVVSGAFVGCSGLILTLVMCIAMNRSMTHVLIGNFGEGAVGKKVAKLATGIVRQVTAEDVVEALTSARSVICVPGFGMAVAKAQHSVAELCTRLRARGINFRFAIHPVAGRLPGHMNVLLAEANVPYDITVSMDDINADFPQTDVVLILGANDTVNPSAQTDPDSPIAGMPVLEVWKAKQTFVMKRTLNVGYAGVNNPLFVEPNNAMYLGDAKASVDKLVALISDVEVPTEAKQQGNGDIEAPSAKKVEKVDDFIGQIPSLQKAAFLKVGVVKEVDEGEKRVAIVPGTARRLLQRGIQVIIEDGAGAGGGFSNEFYENNGAKILPDATALFAEADVIMKITYPSMHPVTKKHEIDMMGKGKTLISFVGPRTDDGKALMAKAVSAEINLLAVDAIPRISRAQSLDVLTSQAKITGYRAVVEAMNVYQRFLNGEMTAAGNFPASKILVVGAGVAGLAAIGTASNMGSIVRAFDTRLETKEQVESLGGDFLVLHFDGEEGEGGGGYAKVMSDEFYKKEMQMFREQAKECQIIITTAAIPGRPAPKLIMKDAVDEMQAGSVIVDLAAASGGNCELTKPGETYVYDDRVTIIGASDLISHMSWQASSMFSNNMSNLLELLCPAAREGEQRGLVIDMNDPVIQGMTCVKEGNITWQPPESMPQPANPPGGSSSAKVVLKLQKESIFSKRVLDLTSIGELSFLVIAAAFLGIVAAYAPVTFVSQLLYFILAGFLGYFLIWNVEPALFSPLMSTSNALSGVVILGGILMVSTPKGSAVNVLGCSAIGVAAINVFGGFAGSYRMLLMFKKEKK